jgi:hypothetical protein
MQAEGGVERNGHEVDARHAVKTRFSDERKAEILRVFHLVRERIGSQEGFCRQFNDTGVAFTGANGRPATLVIARDREPVLNQATLSRWMKPAPVAPGAAAAADRPRSHAEVERDRRDAEVKGMRACWQRLRDAATLCPDVAVVGPPRVQMPARRERDHVDSVDDDE